jgi:hypothetical protein
MKENTLKSNQSGLATPLPDREKIIAEIAYYKAESRGFEPGYEDEDWLAAELELCL